MGINLLPEDIRTTYQIEERHHACSVLMSDFPGEWNDLIAVLRDFTLRRSQVEARGWIEHSFEIVVTADGDQTLAPTHHVDYYKNRIAIETEWNNKDPFFDRDLTTFRLLFDLNVLSVGVIITRADELQLVFDQLGKHTAAGMSTTHMSKLIPKMRNRASGGCPVLAFGITMQKYDPNS